jgi:hypothetical protein
MCGDARKENKYGEKEEDIKCRRQRITSSIPIWKMILEIMSYVNMGKNANQFFYHWMWARP